MGNTPPLAGIPLAFDNDAMCDALPDAPLAFDDDAMCDALPDAPVAPRVRALLWAHMQRDAPPTSCPGLVVHSPCPPGVGCALSPRGAAEALRRLCVWLPEDTEGVPRIRRELARQDRIVRAHVLQDGVAWCVYAPPAPGAHAHVAAIIVSDNGDTTVAVDNLTRRE
jgi:hypothetical protein